MKTVSFSLPETLIVKSREYAQKNGKSLNRFVSELLMKSISEQSTGDWFKEFTQEIEAKKFSSGKWKWNRQELYDE